MFGNMVLCLAIFAFLSFCSAVHIALIVTPFEQYCQYNHYGSLGPCNNAYLDCGNRKLRMKHCHEDQVWSLLGCIGAEDSFCALSSHHQDSINAQTKILARNAHFCRFKPDGVYTVVGKYAECSRQAIICGEILSDNNLVTTCPEGYSIEEKSLNCTRESYYCSKFDEYILYPIHKYIIQKLCAIAKEPAISWDNDICPFWYIDCDTYQVVSCEQDQVYDHEKYACIPMSSFHHCYDERRCFGGEWSKKYSINTCEDHYQWCRGGQHQLFRCDGHGKVFHNGKCLQATDVSQCKRCKHGEVYIDQEHCNKYRICQYGQIVEANCENYYSWSAVYNRCVYDKYCKQDQCQDGETRLINCHIYQVCEHGKLVNKDCGQKSSWSPTEQRCFHDEHCNADGAYHQCHQGDHYSNQHSCAKYHLCEDGKFHDKICEYNYAWNNEKGRCEYDSDCWKSTSKCIEGKYYLHKSKCNMYSHCTDGKLTDYSCAYHYKFDMTRGHCIYDVNCKCCLKNNPPEKSYSHNCYGLYFPHAICNKYYMCKNGKYKERSCKFGYAYNAHRQRCMRDNKCHSEFPSRCVQSYQEYPYDCRFFYQCAHGHLVLQPCAKGTAWSQRLKTCNHIYNTDC